MIFLTGCSLFRNTYHTQGGEAQKTNASNYRPISILSQVNEIVEKNLHKRLTDFTDKYQILINNQFGFRKQLSTNLALLKLHEELLENKETNLFTCLVFLDICEP